MTSAIEGVARVEDGSAAGERGAVASAWADELAFAVSTAASAGAVLMDRYERLERIDHKSARDVVTEADHLSEELVIAAIRARFPADAILAEESGAHAATGITAGGGTARAHAATGIPDGGGAAAGVPVRESPAAGNRTWVIDPLDGTVNYANGLPVFCVSIGLVVDGRPTVGVVLDPTRDETFAATADGPATLNGRVIRASDKAKLTDFVISLALGGRAPAARARAVRREIRISRSMGSAALALAYVANGRFDAFVQESGLSAWDIAAAGLIAERGGATVTAFDGSAWYEQARPTRGSGVVAAPPVHHARVLALASGRS